MGKVRSLQDHRPVVEILTPVTLDRWSNLIHCHVAVKRQTYALDFGGTLLHTIVVDGPHGSEDVWPDARWLWVPPAQGTGGSHEDHGTAAIQYGMQHVMGDLVMCLADDEILEDTCIEKLVDALERTGSDFAMCHRDWPQRPGAKVTGDPPVSTNLTTGLFRPRLWKVADMVSGPSGLYTQPGADGQCAWDWLQQGAELVIVPEVLSHVEPDLSLLPI